MFVKLAHNGEYKNSSRLRGTFGQAARKLKRAEAIGFTSISAIIFIHCVCPAWASFPIKIGINLEGASPLWAEVTLRTISKSQGGLSRGMH